MPSPFAGNGALLFIFGSPFYFQALGGEATVLV